MTTEKCLQCGQNPAVELLANTLPAFCSVDCALAAATAPFPGTEVSIYETLGQPGQAVVVRGTPEKCLICEKPSAMLPPGHTLGCCSIECAAVAAGVAAHGIETKDVGVG